MSSHFKPEDFEDDYGVLAIAGQFICSWRWSSSVLSLELLRHSLWSLSLKRDGLVDTASALTGQQTQILRACVQRPPQQEAHLKDSTTAPFQRACFSRSDTDGSFGKMRRIGKTWSFFILLVWCDDQIMWEILIKLCSFNLSLNQRNC